MSMRIIYHAAKRNGYSGELGDDVSGTRRVMIVGTGQINVPLLTVEGTEQYLQNIFSQQDGWRIVNFDFAQVGSISLTGKRQFSINVVADVPAAFTNQQHLDEFISRLNSYSLDFLVGDTKGISDLYVKISGVDADGVQKTLNAGNPDIPDIKKKNEDDFLTTLAKSLGVSIPVAAVGGLLLFVYLMKD